MIAAKEHEQLRKKLWCDVYIAYVGAANATDPDGATKWADIAVLRFDQSFPQSDSQADVPIVPQPKPAGGR